MFLTNCVIMLNWFKIEQFIHIKANKPQTDCFVESQLFNEARHASNWDRPCLTLMLDWYLTAQPLWRPTPAWEFNSFCIRFRFFTFYAIRYRSAQFVRRVFVLRRWQPLIPSPECSTPGGEHIYIYHPQTDCFAESQLFCVARHVGLFKLGLKPA